MPYKTSEARRAYRKKWRAKNKEKIAETRRKVKLDTLSHYAGALDVRCAYCEEADLTVLQLDHINGGGRQQRKEMGLASAGYGFYLKLKKLGYPEGFQVLCANCNIRKHFGAL